MKEAQIRCKDWLRQSCYVAFDAIGFQAASDSCNAELAEPIMESGACSLTEMVLNLNRRKGWNPYELSRRCVGSMETTLCYPIIK
jgi:hypothetical protein